MSNAQSWSGRDQVNERAWWSAGDPTDDPPLRLTSLGRIALRIAVTALLVIAFAVGFLIRTPLDRAAAECGAITDPCQLTDSPERT